MLNQTKSLIIHFKMIKNRQEPIKLNSKSSTLILHILKKSGCRRVRTQ